MKTTIKDRIDDMIIMIIMVVVFIFIGIGMLVTLFKGEGWEEQW